MADGGAPSTRILNVPNLVTIARLALSIVLFILLAQEAFAASLAVFAVAAGTDWVDGYWARKYGQVTQLGRVLDPFADKLIVCGAFVFLAGGPQLIDGTVASGIPAWVAVLVMARELGVTALRSFIEAGGGDFSAKWAGKWKMLLQCLAIGWSLVRLFYFDVETHTWMYGGPPSWMEYGFAAVLWAAIFLTAYSGLSYVWDAIRWFRRADK